MNLLKAEGGIVNFQSPNYLFDVIPTAKRADITRDDDKLPHFEVKHNYFKNSFFPLTETEWNVLDLNIRNSESLISFKGNILKFVCPSKNNVFLCNNPKGIQLLYYGKRHKTKIRQITDSYQILTDRIPIPTKYYATEYRFLPNITKPFGKVGICSR